MADGAPATSGLARALCRAAVGLDAPLVTVECHLSGGLPSFNMVGLPEGAVREARERVRSALLAQGFSYPDRRITINLAPAALPKQGARFDLAVALAILAAEGRVSQAALDRHEVLAELALDGTLRGGGAILPAAAAAAADQRPLIAAPGSAATAALDPGVAALAAADLRAVVAHLDGSARLPRMRPAPAPPRATVPTEACFAGIEGQHAARRALVVAATGGHNCLLYGPPGTGKSLLASRFPRLLPPLTEGDALEVARIRSLQNEADAAPLTALERPYRAPHHSASATALVGGGGAAARPGEVTLAHLGVLFLDELPEFDRRALDMLREPLETGHVDIARTGFRVRWPARFQLLAAMNPCPAGIECPGSHGCRCTPQQRLRYRQRLSAPLLDRIDLHVQVPQQPASVVLQTQADPSASGAATSPDERRCAPPADPASLPRRIAAARDRQLERRGRLNARLEPRELLRDCDLPPEELQRLQGAADSLGLSARACHRILRVARSIADLATSPKVEREHLEEAIGYRSRSPLGP